MKQTFVKAAALTALLAAVACGGKQNAQGPAQYAMMTVAATDTSLPTQLTASIQGRQDIAIMPQVAGTISRMCVTEGQRVSEGQTLFIIDQVPYKAALQTAEANVEAAKAALATAQLTDDSKKQLFDNNVISQFELSTADNALLTAKAQLDQMEAQRVNAANNLSYTVVKAPSNGVVGTFPYRVGALVGPTSPQPLTVVSDNETMYIYFSINENQLTSLIRQYGTLENTVKNMPDVQLALNDGSIYAHTGRVESISGVIDATTGTASLRASFPNPEGLLHTGSVGKIIMPNNFKNVIVIPQAATFEVQDKIFVYTIDNGVSKALPIEVSPVSDGKNYIVTAGLTSGQQIVAEGVGMLRPGTPIAPKPAAAQTTATGASQAAAPAVKADSTATQTAGTAQKPAADTQTNK